MSPDIETQSALDEAADAWTGERYVTSVKGDLEYEHVHRYLFAAGMCPDAVVLDVACGEGYGTNILAKTAKAVIGIDIDDRIVGHAARKYVNSRLSFLAASCTQIPLASGVFDVVVSFETIEHITEYEAFLGEVQRVLKPDGLFIVSTPDRVIYDQITPCNAFHLHEFSRDEIEQILRERFAHVELRGQQYLEGSFIDGVADEARILGQEESSSEGPLLFYMEDIDRSVSQLARSTYLLALASNAPLPVPPLSLLTADLFALPLKTGFLNLSRENGNLSRLNGQQAEELQTQRTLISQLQREVEALQAMDQSVAAQPMTKDPRFDMEGRVDDTDAEQHGNEFMEPSKAVLNALARSSAWKTWYSGARAAISDIQDETVVHGMLLQQLEEWLPPVQSLESSGDTTLGQNIVEFEPVLTRFDDVINQLEQRVRHHARRENPREYSSDP